MADKNEFLSRVEKQLSEMKTSLKVIRKKMVSAPAEERPMLARKADALEKRYRFGLERIQELTETSDYVWEGLQDELELFWQQLTEDTTR